MTDDEYVELDGLGVASARADKLNPRINAICLRIDDHADRQATGPLSGPFAACRSAQGPQPGHRGSSGDRCTRHARAHQAVTAAFDQRRPQASATLRGYFTANPQEHYDLRGILAPIADTQRQRNVTVLPPDLASAYGEFMAG
jgi:heme-binding protein